MSTPDQVVRDIAGQLSYWLQRSGEVELGKLYAGSAQLGYVPASYAKGGISSEECLARCEQLVSEYTA
jgi:hypothetical protein